MNESVRYRCTAVGHDAQVYAGIIVQLERADGYSGWLTLRGDFQAMQSFTVGKEYLWPPPEAK